MPAERVLTTQTPGSTANDANSPRVLGADVKVNSATPGDWTAVYWYLPGPTLPLQVNVGVWKASAPGALLASASGTPVATGWLRVPIPAVPVETDVAYTVAGEITLGSGGASPDYGFTTGGLAADIVNGDLTMLAHTGRFHNNVGSLVYPDAGSGDFLFFADVEFTPSSGDAIAPAAPTGLHFTGIGQTTVSLGWNAATDNVGVTGYDVYVDNVFAVTVTGLSTTVAGLTTGTLHSFKVRARDAAGNISAPSSSISTVTDVVDPAWVNVGAELALNRRVTQQFIAANPTTLVLQTGAMVKTAGGGKVRSATASRPAQVFRLIAQNSAIGNLPGPQSTGDGEARKSTYQLLGQWDSTMQVGDWWESGGKRFEVIELLPFNGYETRGRVVSDG